MDDKLNVMCTDVLQEIRPLAVVEVSKELEEKVRKIVETYGLKAITTYDKDHKKAAIWIFKYYHFVQVIEEVSKIYYKPYPISVFDRWVLCKAFGCSEKAIEQILADIEEET